MRPQKLVRGRKANSFESVRAETVFDTAYVTSEPTTLSGPAVPSSGPTGTDYRRDQRGGLQDETRPGGGDPEEGDQGDFSAWDEPHKSGSE